MCSESNHLSPNDFFSFLAYGILRILKIYTAYCLNESPPMHAESFKSIPPKGVWDMVYHCMHVRSYIFLLVTLFFDA